MNLTSRLCCFALLALTSCSSPLPATRDLNAERPFQRTEGWLGGDGAGTVVLDDTALWLFGDSGIGHVNDKGAYAEGSTLVNNTLGVQLLHNSLHGQSPIRYYWREAVDPADGKTKPAPLFKPRSESEWYWPTGGGTSFQANGQTTLILFMSRIFRPRPKDDGIWNFDGRGSDMLVITNPGPDPREWQPRTIETPGALKPGETPNPGTRRITWGTAVIGGDNLAIFGIDTTDPTNKKAILARVPAPEATDTSKWLFWSRGHWSPNINDCTSIADNLMDEYSVSEIKADRASRFVMVYSEPMLGKRIFARTAKTLIGPWSEPETLYTCPEPDHDKRLFAYSAKAHPELSMPGELMITYCVNSNDFWHMLSEACIYRPRVVRVPAP